MNELRPLRQDFGFLLAIGRARVLRTVNAGLAEHDLHVRSYSVLALACEREGVSQRELSDELQLDPSQIVAIVDGLEAAGWVERRVHNSDRRVRALVPTPEGREKHRAATLTVMAIEDDLLAPLGDEQRQTLLHLLSQIARGDHIQLLT